MRIVIDLDGAHELFDVTSFEPQATLGQLIETCLGMQLDNAEQLYLDRTPVTPETELRELTILEGSRVSRTPKAAPQQISGWSVALSAGVVAGEAVSIPEHRKMVIGRAPQADLVLPTESASWEHCTLDVEDDGVWVRDAGSTNGTLVDGHEVDAEGVLVTGPAQIIIGGSALMLRPELIEPAAPAPGSLRNLTPAATAPFNRPPNLGQSPPADPIEPPAPKEVQEAAKFNLIVVLAPLLMAGVLIAVLGDIRFAMFALLSPVMGIGMYFEGKRRRSKGLKEEAARFAQTLIDLQNEMVEAAGREARRLDSVAPDPSVILRRAQVPSTLLWLRRADHPDCLTLRVGTGDVPWQPPLDTRSVTKLDDQVKTVLAQGGMNAAPVVADLNDAGVIGLAGDREGALALARSLITQAAVHVGPADLTIGLFCDNGREAEWDWVSWLPHTRQGIGDGSRWMSHHRKHSTSMLRTLLDGIEGLPTELMLTVIDSEVLTEGRDSPARDLLGHGRTDPAASIGQKAPTRKVSGIVIAPTTDQLPAVCTTVVEVGHDAACVVVHDDSTDAIRDVILSGVSLPDAEECARALAHFEDPELVLPGASLPTITKLHEILGTEEMSPELVLRLWETHPDLTVPIGFGESGLFKVDLVHDGPHGVVAGTTGSGKSEILKALLASLVAHLTPEQLSLILVDFKGGAAFKAFERLPHTIGTISNLDEQLADRAIRALQAEMRRRQRLFAAAGEGIENLPAYLATNPKEPLPRVLFIVDEFKELVKDFPDVLASLVSVAAIGRTLGVHMILATQQPAGVVSEAILTNSNLRIAARVQKKDDSSSVISDGSAATISRFHRGRAYVQRGQDDLELVQTAFVSAPVRAANSQQIDVREVGTFGSIVDSTQQAQNDQSATDLDMLMEAVVEANRKAGFAPPRRVWPEALGERVTLDGYRSHPVELAPGVLAAPRVGGVTGETVNIALADDPDRQRQMPVGWNMGEGNLLLIGVPGSGTSTTLATLALSLAHTSSPDDLDILCLDMGSRVLAPIAGLPHTTAYVGSGPNAKEQQLRFLRHLRTELQRRRESSEPTRKAVVLIDGLAALRDELQDYEGQQMLDALYRVYADGPSVGLHFVVTTTRGKSIPSAMDEVTTQRWVYRLADDYDYSAFGIKGTVKPAAIPGRCVDTTVKLQMHVATPDFGLESAVDEAAERWASAQAKPDAIGAFPENVAAAGLADHVDLSGEPIRLPIGLREDTLDPAFLDLYEGEHVLVAGPSRSGKSTLLLAIAETLRALPADQRPAIWGIHDRRSPLGKTELDRAAGNVDDIPALIASLGMENGPVVLLIDDVERVDDPGQSLATLLASPPAGMVVITAGRSTDLRTMYSHWTKAIRKSRCGVILQPDVDYDGELLGAKLPRRAPVAMTAGRGYACVGGAVSLVQTMSSGV